ncbi:Glutathione transferase fosA [Leclercia adecarboxylata]|uniref:Glutathione transferase fosA n=1 Tax=Leclercia adecarboxylata TaxID=83655 RepID=A0A4V6YXU1_9ENTR|nr:Glutathione transferase fosA [Leclercia adecarboxylata]
MLNALNHLTLAVSNLPASIAFWRDLLGLRLHAEWHTGAYLTCGDLWLCLSYDETRQFIPPQNSDYTHYAFSVEPEHFEAVAQKLKDAGVTVWKREQKRRGVVLFSRPGRAQTGTACGRSCRASGRVSGEALRGNGFYVR